MKEDGTFGSRSTHEKITTARILIKSLEGKKRHLKDMLRSMDNSKLILNEQVVKSWTGF